MSVGWPTMATKSFVAAAKMAVISSRVIALERSTGKRIRALAAYATLLVLDPGVKKSTNGRKRHLSSL